jgi:hypothetical protein
MTKKVTEKGSRYIAFLIPGLLGMKLMGTGIWSIAFSITDARNCRVLKRLIATPMRRGDYLLSYIMGRSSEKKTGEQPHWQGHEIDETARPLKGAYPVPGRGPAPWIRALPLNGAQRVLARGS